MKGGDTMKRKVYKKVKIETAHEFVQYVTEGKTENIKPLSEKLGVPYNTVYNWFSGLSDIPKHFLRFMIFTYNHLDINKNM